MNLLSWNIAGIRAKLKRGFLDFLKEGTYDVICWQETKAEEAQVELPEALKEMYPYRTWVHCDGVSQRKGLNGVAIWSKTKPVSIIPSMEPGRFRSEGRTLGVEFETFNLVTVYTPNSQCDGSERYDFRTNNWDGAFREWVQELNAKKPTIVCGDFNVAVEDIDVKHPDKWAGSAGLLPKERDNFKELMETGLVDSFRHLHPTDEEKYTYWNQRMPWERKANIGWRIDYFLVPTKMQRRIKKSRDTFRNYGVRSLPHRGGNTKSCEKSEKETNNSNR